MQEDRKARAAIAGVLSYIKTREEEYIAEPQVSAHMPTPWQLSGRQSIMQMRGLMQRRVLKRL